MNVASKCGLTPQYTASRSIHEKYARPRLHGARLPVQPVRSSRSPARPRRSSEFCTTNYGVTFPLFEKIDVNGDDRHPLYAELTQTADAEGHTGDIRWNFEKFLVGRDGEVVGRFSPMVEPESDELLGAIEEQLAR